MKEERGHIADEGQTGTSAAHGIPPEGWGTEGAPNEPSRREVWRMFDRIAHRYDLLNRLLSFGRDVAWRRKLSDMVPAQKPLHLLDVACGTCDLLLTLTRRNQNITRGTGLDMAGEMLKLGQVKIGAEGLTRMLNLVHGDAQNMPFVDDCFDLVTIAFGVRNFADLRKGLSEMARVLRPGGQVMILEFSLPRNRFIRWSYLLYFRHILPWLGGVISGDRAAYQYLNRTVETFPYGEEFCKLLTEVGFVQPKARPLTFGVATIYTATATIKGGKE
ncbi:MAG TPA: bifunctional demethylmenaquinone methyltransferase/2-methoxy-6-polyprenyl-1,4-benzoquinol methylase UbiE [candidate division Zixibacteria bacterium]|nr:bifunctional demethylmenaquinone methyltransferase/2-methoxy-6-polyprenyl-1,4-benzoquinol methylase UbiE [candidate division Zixibacteria bacterium]